MKWTRLSDRAATGLLLIVITLGLSLTGALSRVDNVIYDVAQQTVDREIPEDVVLVAIDEQSLFALGRWPWSRRLHAQLIQQLHADGAKVIGVDVMFTEPQRDDPQADRLLAQSFAQAGNVVLPVVIEKVRRNGQLIESLPLPELVAHVAALGRVHAELDADAIARSITLWEGLGQPVWPHFAQAMLATAGQSPPNLSGSEPQVGDAPLSELVKHDQRYINFATANRHLPTISYVQALRSEYSPGTFRNKLVLIGATASGMADSLPTPVSGFQQPMPGVEFLANAMISMRAQTLVSLSPLWFSTLLACAIAVLPMWWLPYTSARKGLMFNIAFALLVFFSSMVLPVFLHIWVPLTAGLLGILSAYPLWAWRKLESASRFLDAELTRLQQELEPTHFSAPLPDTAPRHANADPFQHRIDQVRAATFKLQHLEQEQRETLAFISHDIRVPLASAAAQIKQDLGDQHSSYKKLSRALVWTEDFLQTSRAQMLQPNAFVEFDLVGLLHETVDEIYPLAQAKSLRLEVNLPDDPVWIKGHFDTLSRAIVNLLGNALKFSPPNGVIQLRAKTSATQVHITISDQGEGIALQDQEKIFKRFERLEPQAHTTKAGAGLGLYFVQTTVHKHGGTVKVVSRPNLTTFCIDLPM